MSRFPRMSGWLLLAIVLVVSIAAVSPQQLPVALYKLCLITLAGVVGYWLDRGLFPYARPDSYLTASDWRLRLREIGKQVGDADLRVANGYELIFAAVLVRRALIVGACILGVAMGL